MHRKPHALLLSLPLLAACAAAPHPWRYQGDHAQLTIPLDAWPLLPLAQSCQAKGASWREEREKRARAEEQLAKADSIPVSLDEVREYCVDFSLPTDTTLRPYLVRAVSRGAPWYAVVRFEPSTRQLSTCQVAYDGEMLLLPSPDFTAAPLVVFLPAQPSKVYPTALYGGDWVGNLQWKLYGSRVSDSTR